MRFLKYMLAFIAHMAVMCIVFFHLDCHAEIITVNTTKELMTVLDKACLGSIVIFDVDDVLITPNNTIQRRDARHLWGSHMKEMEKKYGKERKDFLHGVILLNSIFKLTDTPIPQIVAQLQQKEILTLALTAFSTGKMGAIDCLEDWRYQQLKELGIDFTSCHYLMEDKKLSKDESAKKSPVLKHGILFTNYHPKGEVLDQFLGEYSAKLSSIFFVDDREYNLRSVEQYATKKNIPFIGILDNRVANYTPVCDEKTAQLQFEILQTYEKWLSDEEAADYLLAKIQD